MINPFFLHHFYHVLWISRKIAMLYWVYDLCTWIHGLLQVMLWNPLVKMLESWVQRLSGQLIPILTWCDPRNSVRTYCPFVTGRSFISCIIIGANAWCQSALPIRRHLDSFGWSSWSFRESKKKGLNILSKDVLGWFRKCHPLALLDAYVIWHHAARWQNPKPRTRFRISIQKSYTK